MIFSQTVFPRTDNVNERGLTLRDFAAITALPAVIVQCAEDYRDGEETIEQMFARKSYALADAMLAQRTKGDAA